MNALSPHILDAITSFGEMIGINKLIPTNNGIFAFALEGGEVFNLEYSQDSLFSFYVFEVDAFDIDRACHQTLLATSPDLHYPQELRTGLMGEKHIVLSIKMNEEAVTPNQIVNVFELLIKQKETLQRSLMN